ncbi:GNAT family N-acetyltransferase [Mycoplasmatota bacterium WC44]
MLSINEALEVLNNDKNFNCNLIYSLENSENFTIHKVNNSLVIKATDYDEYTAIVLDDNRDLEIIKKEFNDKDKYFYFINDFTMDEIINENSLEWKLDCKQFILEDYSHLEKGKHETTRLTKDDAKTMYDNSIYQETLDVDYLQSRIELGYTCAVRENGKLVAWAFTHDDNAIGGLHVLDEYRNNGYGYSVTYSIIKEVIDKHGIAYVQVLHNNDKSQNLVKKLGFKFERNINFIKIK